jgi:hypothetical protein
MLVVTNAVGVMVVASNGVMVGESVVVRTGVAVAVCVGVGGNVVGNAVGVRTTVLVGAADGADDRDVVAVALTDSDAGVEIGLGVVLAADEAFGLGRGTGEQAINKNITSVTNPMRDIELHCWGICPNTDAAEA